MSRTRLVSGVTLAACVAILASAHPVVGQERSLRQQHVRVAVVDRQHAPVTGLAPRDFAVREGGVAREIISVAPAATPLTVGIVADDSQATQPLSAELRAGLHALAKELYGAPQGTEVALMTTGERPTRVVDFTALSSQLDDGIRRVFPRTGAGSYLLDGILEMAGLLARQQAPRPTIIAIVAESGPEFSAATRERIESALRQQRIALWTIVLQSSASGLSTERRERAEVVVDLARESGGLARTVVAPQGLESACRSVGALLRTEYDVVYGRPDTLIPPKDREVRTTREGTTAIATRWITP
jgi:VWFA-related protein